MSQEKDSKVMEHEGVNGYSKQPTGGRFKRHCAKRWWVYLIILIILVLVIVLPIIYVGYPNLAQKKINKSTLAVTSESITNPTPNAVDIDMETVILTNSSQHPHLDAFDGDLYLEDSDTPFLTLQIPATQAKNGTKATVKQTAQIENLDAFTDYTIKTLVSDTFAVRLRGKGGLKLGSLPHTSVNYNQKINLKGFNGLKGMNVTSFELLNETNPDGSNSVGTVFIPNPTVMTLAMGNVSLDMSVDGTFIGNATLPNLTLEPGNKTYPIRITSNQTAVVGLLQAKYGCGILPVDIAGNKSVYEGQELTYYSKALQANKLTNELNVRPALEALGFGFVLKNESEC